MAGLLEQIKNNPYYKNMGRGVEPAVRTDAEMKKGNILGVTPTPIGILEAMASVAGKFGAEKFGAAIAGANTTTTPDIYGNVTEPPALSKTNINPPPSQTPRVNTDAAAVVREATPQSTMPKANATPKGYGVEGAIANPGTVTEYPKDLINPALIGKSTRPNVAVEGNTFTSINPNTQPLGAEAALPVSSLEKGTEINPNDEKLAGIMDMLTKAAGGALSETNLLKRKYDILAVKAIQDALTGVAPLTSKGHFGVEAMKNEVEKGKLGVAQGRLGVEQGTLNLAKTKEGREALESAAKGEYYKANAAESKAKAKYWDASVPKAEGFEAQAQKSWLTGWDNYLKNDLVISDLLDKTPEERDAAILAHQQLYRKLNPPPAIRKVDNPDGTITVTFADGTVQKMKPKKGVK